MSFCNCSMLVYKTTVDVCILIFYPAALLNLNSLASLSNFFVGFLIFYMNNHYSVHKESFILFLTVHLSFLISLQKRYTRQQTLGACCYFAKLNVVSSRLCR